MQSLVQREPSTQDHRKIALQLTQAGEAVLDEARIGTQTRLAELLTQLSAEQCETVLQALKYLQPLFPPAEEKDQGEKRL